MNRDALAEELGQPGARELLQSAPLARLAYNGPDGFPRVVPCGFLWTGGAIVVCTATTAPKAKALAVRPDVALTIDSAGTSAAAQSLLVRGTARLDTVEGVADECLQAAAKTMDGEDLAGFEQAGRATYEQMVRITVTPAWAHFFDFEAGRLPRYLQELVTGERRSTTPRRSRSINDLVATIPQSSPAPPVAPGRPGPELQ
jgi:nitroimidazol reductase NimA-like FMN-containing flavoprotein (pyridoxamine 5'-phosphate oxidase superfamily)